MDTPTSDSSPLRADGCSTPPDWSAAAEVAGIGAWRWRDGELRASPQMSVLLGLPREEATLSRDALMACAHPDDRAALEAALTNDEAEFTLELRVAAPEEPRYLELRGRCENGELLGVAVDVTARTEREAKREAECERQADILRTQAAALLDIDQRFVLALATGKLIAGEIDLTSPRGNGRWLGDVDELLGEEPGTFDGTLQMALSRVHPDDLPGFMAAREKAQREQVPYSHDFRVLRRDGSTRWLEARGAFFTNEQGQVVRSFGAFLDVTERKRAESAVREERNFNAAVLRVSGALIHVLDPNRHTVTFNPACERASGYSAEEVLGRDFTDFLLTPDEREPVREAVAELLNGCSRLTRVNDWVTKSGERRRISWSNSPLFDENGEVTHVVSVGIDITERMRAEEQVRALNRDLERRIDERTHELRDALANLQSVNAELEAFSYSVSHDLRAPLRAIDGFGAALLEDYGPILPPEAHGQLGIIRGETARMGELIDDLLELSQVTRSGLSREQIDVSALARQVSDELRAREPERTVEILIAPNLIAHGDRRMLLLLLEHLLGNAWKFTGKTEGPCIEVGTNENDAFFVRDNGAGFDMAYASRLFGAFQRLHPRADFAGTGIGLAIAQRIVHRHGGQIWAHGQVGRGATFHWTL